jgi:hypothetical protein
VQANSGGFFEQAPAFLCFQGKSCIHEPLSDDRIGPLRQAGLRQQLGYISQANALPVQHVFVLPVPVSAAGDCYFAEIDGQPAVTVVENDRG